MYTMAQTEPLMKSDPDWFDFTFESIWEEVRKKGIISLAIVMVVMHTIGAATEVQK